MLSLEGTGAYELVENATPCALSKRDPGRLAHGDVSISEREDHHSTQGQVRHTNCLSVGLEGESHEYPSVHVPANYWPSLHGADLTSLLHPFGYTNKILQLRFYLVIRDDQIQAEAHPDDPDYTRGCFVAKI